MCSTVRDRALDIVMSRPEGVAIDDMEVLGWASTTVGTWQWQPGNWKDKAPRDLFSCPYMYLVVFQRTLISMMDCWERRSGFL